MTTVIREATIKLKIEQEGFEFDVPSLQPAQEAVEKLNTELGGMDEAAGQAADATANYIDAISEAASSANVEVVQASGGVVESIDAISEAASKAADEVQESSGSATKAIDGMGSTAIDTASEIEDANSRMVEANLRAADSFRAAGEGAFTVARGVAFLSSSSEEDMQRMLQNIAAVQGGFDLFRGSIEVVKGLREAQVALAAAQTATTAGMGAQTVAAGALSVALGPVGIGVAATLGIAATAWAAFGNAAEDASDRTTSALDISQRKIQDQITELERFAQLQDKLAGFQSTEEQIASLQAELSGLGPAATADSAAERTGLKEAEARLADLRRQEADNLERRSSPDAPGFGTDEFRLLQARRRTIEIGIAQATADVETRRGRTAGVAEGALETEGRRSELQEQLARLKIQQEQEEQRRNERRLAELDRQEQQAQSRIENAERQLGTRREQSPRDVISSSNDEIAKVEAERSRLRQLQAESLREQGDFQEQIINQLRQSKRRVDGLEDFQQAVGDGALSN